MGKQTLVSVLALALLSPILAHLVLEAADDGLGRGGCSCGDSGGTARALGRILVRARRVRGRRALCFDVA